MLEGGYGRRRCTTFGASNHKSARATPGSFAIVTNQNGAWSDVGPGLLPTHRAVAADGEPEEVLDEIAVNCGEDGRRLVDHPQLKAKGSSTHTQASLFLYFCLYFYFF